MTAAIPSVNAVGEWSLIDFFPIVNSFTRHDGNNRYSSTHRDPEKRNEQRGDWEVVMINKLSLRFPCFLVPLIPFVVQYGFMSNFMQT